MRQTVPITQFRNQCLRLLEQVKSTGEELVVTKHGRPVAAVIPVGKEPKEPLFGWSSDIMQIQDDLTKPAIPSEDWHIVSDPDRILTGRPSD